MPEPDFTVAWRCSLCPEPYQLAVYSSVDKIEGYYFYRCQLGENQVVTISKFAGSEWLDVRGSQHELARQLGPIVEIHSLLLALAKAIG